MSQLKIQSPPITWKELKNYQLKNLKKDFNIAEFERRASPAHIKDIVNAILSNRFYDNVARVVKATKPWVVIDGQHRLQALWICYTQHGLKSYNLMLAIYPENYARTIYRRNNMGKPLLTRDHSKALDDKKTPFFLELQPWLSHDRTPTRGTYVEMLHALHYAKGAKHPVSIRELDQVVAAITKQDIEIMKAFCQAVKTHSPVVFKARIYYAAIYRNVFRVGLEHKFTEKQFASLIKLTTDSRKVLETAMGRKHSDILICYKIINDEILPKVK